MSTTRWFLIVDLLTARALVWMASWGRDAELRPDVHSYFFDRYSRLAALYRQRGAFAHAWRLDAKARQHWLGEDPEPPYAAAMAMPRPRQPERTHAVSDTRVDPVKDPKTDRPRSRTRWPRWQTALRPPRRSRAASSSER